MVNYIEEMMNTAGVHYTFKPIYKFRNDGTLDNDLQKELPKFTAEKQLRLILLISKERTNIMLSAYNINTCIDSYSDGYFDIDTQCYDSNIVSENSVTFYYIPFEQALAKLTLELIEENKLDKEKVRNILND